MTSPEASAQATPTGETRNSLPMPICACRGISGFACTVSAIGSTAVAKATPTSTNSSADGCTTFSASGPPALAPHEASR